MGCRDAMTSAAPRAAAEMAWAAPDSGNPNTSTSSTMQLALASHAAGAAHAPGPPWHMPAHTRRSGLCAACARLAAPAAALTAVLPAPRGRPITAQTHSHAALSKRLACFALEGAPAGRRAAIHVCLHAHDISCRPVGGCCMPTGRCACTRHCEGRACQPGAATPAHAQPIPSVGLLAHQHTLHAAGSGSIANERCTRQARNCCTRLKAQLQLKCCASDQLA